MPRDTVPPDEWIDRHRPLKNDTTEPRPAKVFYEEGWAWPGEPWPWCELREWPHDSHVTNGGNTQCPGREGVLPPITLERATRLTEAAGAALDRASREVNEAQRRYMNAIEAYAVAREREFTLRRRAGEDV